MESVTKQFIAGKLETGCFTYIGFDIKQQCDRIVLDQSAYTEDLDCIAVDVKRAKQKKDLLNRTEIRQYRSIVGKCSWVARGSRPDIAYEVIELSTKLT